MYILLVEDDLNLGKALSRILQSHYRVHWVRTLASAKSHFDAAGYDLVLLDLGLPDGDGVEWLESLRLRRNDVPVLIISARDTLDDRVQGLDTGADDYLTKPFEADELMARVRAMLRRRSGGAGPRVESGDLSLDPVARRFYLGDEPLDLPPKEHQLLAVLVHAAGRPVARERLIQQLYGLGESAASNTLEVHIHGLRKLIGRRRIETIRGFGYRLSDG